MTEQTNRVHPGFGPRSLRALWYRLFIILGNVTGLAIGGALAPRHGISPEAFIGASLYLAGIALVGARLWYASLHLRQFRGNWRRLFDTSQAGAAVDGGVALALLSAGPVLATLEVPFLAYLDSAVFWLLPAAIIGRFGCLTYGCCAGRTNDGPFAFWLPNHMGAQQKRLPSQVFESLLAGSIFLIALGSPASGAGLLFALCLGLYSVGRGVLWFTRESQDTPVSALMKFGLWMILSSYALGASLLTF